MQTIQAEKPKPGEFVNDRPVTRERVRDLALDIQNAGRRVGNLADLRVTPQRIEDAKKALKQIELMARELKRELRL